MTVPLRRFKSWSSSTRSRSYGRSLVNDDVFEMHIDEEVKRNQEDLLQFGSRSRRPTRQKPSFRRNTNKIRESISSNRDSDSSSSRFKPSRPSLSRNRFSSRITQRTQSVSPSSTALVNPTPSKRRVFQPKLIQTLQRLSLRNLIGSAVQTWERTFWTNYFKTSKQ